MTDISKYRSLAVSHDTYDKIGKIAKILAPGVTLSRAQTIKVIVDEKEEIKWQVHKVYFQKRLIFTSNVIR